MEPTAEELIKSQIAKSHEKLEAANYYLKIFLNFFQLREGAISVSITVSGHKGRKFTYLMAAIGGALGERQSWKSIISSQ